MKKQYLISLISFLVIATSLVSGAGYFYFTFKSSAPSSSAEEIVYEVVQGTSFNQVAQELEERGVVTNAKAFSLYAKFVGLRSKMKTGEYAFRGNMIPDEVLTVLVSGKSIQRPITIPEGYNLFEIGAVIEKAGLGTQADFMQMATNQEFIQSLIGEPLPSLEGYLFPETYMLSKRDNLQKLLSLMVKAALENFEKLKLKDPTSPIFSKFSRHQIFTLASIVEKETGAGAERPKIASVFLNRIDQGMRLQTDPTVIYGKALLSGVLEINITKIDLLTPTPYNTYTIPGLPPGPIANPGIEALDAVINPEKTSYLFFVSQNDGTHVFTENYKDHVNAVKKFQLDPKAREGKSWRDLNQ